MADEKYGNEGQREEEERSFGTTGEFTEGWEEEHSPTDFSEETAAEAAPVAPYAVSDRDEVVDEYEEDDSTMGRTAGIFAVVLSILSLFFLPILLGIAGIVIGFVSRRGGAKGLGNWAIGIGALSIIMKVLFAPLF